MQSLQRDRSTKNTCETLILVSGPTHEHVDPDLSDFVVPVQQAVVPGKGERYQSKSESFGQPEFFWAAIFGILLGVTNKNLINYFFAQNWLFF